MISEVDGSFPNREKNLLRVAYQLTNHSHRDIISTARLLLGKADQKIQPIYNSRLNNDGSPLQFCISASQHGQSLRILGDPRSDITNTKIRHRYALLALYNLMKASADASLKRAVETTLECNLPDDTKGYLALKAGTLWLGAPISDAKGIAVYLNGRWGTPCQQWERVNHWLDKLIPTHESRVEALTKLPKYAVIASVGLEGADDKRLRYKIYFRLTGAVDLRKLGIDLLRSEQFLKFLELTIADHQVSSTGIVFCIGLSAATGEIIDAKIDLCGHCLAPIIDNWTTLLETLSYQINLPLSETFMLAVHQQHSGIAFLGCGVKNDGSVRLNLYLKGRE
jgi:hypothetical protein